MIDVHCHLEQRDYDKDRQKVIDECKKHLKAVISSAAHPKDFRLALNVFNTNKKFVFISLGIHPEFIKEISEQEIDNAIEFIRKNSNSIIAIGEIGLDYHWVKEDKWRKRQKELFIRMLNLASELKKPVVVHCRDGFDDAIDILNSYELKILMHLFSSRRHLDIIKKNEWSISIGPGIAKSKDMKKIARDMPLEGIMLETDSPWFGFGKRNSPVAIKEVAEKIAEIKKIKFEEIWLACTKNAIKFFNLPLNL